MELSLNQGSPHSQLSFNGTTNLLRNITNLVGGATEYNLTWGSDTLATQPWVTCGLAGKQNTLSFQNETPAPGNIDLSSETAATPTYISWPGFTAPSVVNATGYQSLMYTMYTSLSPNSAVYFQADFRAGTTSSVTLSVNNIASW